MPAGVISLYIDLRRPLFLSEDQQDYSCVNSLDPETLSSPYRFEPNASQPFALSEEIYLRDVHDLPATCKARLEFDLYLLHFINPLKETEDVLPGYSYHGHRSSATQSFTACSMFVCPNNDVAACV